MRWLEIGATLDRNDVLNTSSYITCMIRLSHLWHLVFYFSISHPTPIPLSLLLFTHAFTIKNYFCMSVQKGLKQTKRHFIGKQYFNRYITEHRSNDYKYIKLATYVRTCSCTFKLSYVRMYACESNVLINSSKYF